MMVAMRLSSCVAAAALAALPLATAGAGEPSSLCEQLAAQVRHSGAVPDGSPSPWIVTVKPHETAVNALLRHRMEAHGVLSTIGPGSILELGPSVPADRRAELPVATR
jgi:hypothetical protein